MGALGVGAAHHGAVRNCGVFHQAVLDLRGTDAVTRALEHVIGAALVPEIAFRVALREVSGAAPSADDFLARRLGMLPLLEKRYRVAPRPDPHSSELHARAFS